MKKINIQFNQEKGKRDIDIVFTASEKDDEVLSLMDRVRDPLSGTLNAYDEGGATVALKEESIISISTGSKNLSITAESGIYEMKLPLRDAEQMLHPASFLRISRYEIINLSKVRKFDFSISGSLRIEMKNGYETWASRRFISEIRKRLEQNKQSIREKE